jgi:glycosyltransferase involved in cell wall biosynthesis
MFRFADRAALRVLAFQLNDTFIGPLDHTIDLYMHPSEWHAERFRAMYPEMAAHKQRPRITNGIDPTRYVSEVEVPREPHRVVYSSSPDRGLHHLLRVWPKVREAIPDAELHVFYEINKWLELVDEIVAKGLAVNTADRAEAVRQFATEHENYEEELGVFFHGGVGQARLAKEQLASAVLAYPCDPVQPTEGFSMTCLEAIASGCSLITTNADALQELWADAPNVTILPLPIDDNIWVETIVKELRAAEADPSRHEPILPKQYTWATIAQLWDQAIKDALATRGKSNV